MTTDSSKRQRDVRLAMCVLAGTLSVLPLAEAQTGNVAAGKEAYAENCRSCHGPNGEGNPNMAKKLGVEIRDLRLPAVQKSTDEVWRKQILEGVGKMNATEDIKPKEVTDIIAFMRSLAPTASQAPASSAPSK